MFEEVPTSREKVCIRIVPIRRDESLGLRIKD